jgi:hypothetical protein
VNDLEKSLGGLFKYELQRGEPIASKIPNHKFQIPNKLQIPISNNQKDFVSNLGDCDLSKYSRIPPSSAGG